MQITKQDKKPTQMIHFSKSRLTDLTAQDTSILLRLSQNVYTAYIHIYLKKKKD